MEISKADLVQSVAGRDQGKLFYVIGTEGVYVLIADGKLRTIEHPKRKKTKHVRRVTRTESHVAEKLLRGERYSTANYEGTWRCTAGIIRVKTKEVKKESWQKTM